MRESCARKSWFNAGTCGKAYLFEHHSHRVDEGTSEKSNSIFLKNCCKTLRQFLFVSCQIAQTVTGDENEINLE
jgi:hypothetical protein